VRKLPIGIQSFVRIREENFYYVDKTHFIRMLVDEGGGYYFLSRPRRFGKSLFLDTLRQAFLAREDLFKGLYLENNWDWSVKYPVIKISFGAGAYKNLEELEHTKDVILRNQARDHDVKLEEKYAKDKFMELIYKLYKKYNQKVVILIDEYDKPILDNIEDAEIAMQMRESLKSFYSVIKDADEFLKFVFITGVTKFSKVSIFSGLNNLRDITLIPEYGSVCGYTQNELEEVFKDRLDGVNIEEIKLWYNGYSWLSEKVYNPFDVLLYLQEKIFRPYWFETGTPTFLIKLLIQNKVSMPNLEKLEIGEEIVESFDVDRMYPETLLFQTGYLTIVERKQRGQSIKYILDWPNLEVKMSFSNHILNTYLRDLRIKEKELDKIYESLEKSDMRKMEKSIKSFFASIPNEWYRKSEIEKYEGFYASVFYAYITALGMDVKVEDCTNTEKVDMVVKMGEKCYIFEFKVVRKKSEKGNALRQIKEKKYHEKYVNKSEEIYLIGIEFGKEERNIVSFEYEKL